MIDTVPIDDLKVIAEISQPDLSWEFDEYLVWADLDGRLYYGHDSGCSCPTPFEDFKTTADMQALTWHNWDQFLSEIEGWYGGNVGDRNAFTQKVKAALSDPACTGQAVAAYRKERAEQKRKDELHRAIKAGLSDCKKQLAEVHPDVNYKTTWYMGPMVDVVESLQKEATQHILVLGVYLTRMAEETLAANRPRPVADNPQA